MKGLAKLTAGIAAAIIFAAAQASAQFSLTTTSYSQNFDALGSAGTSISVLTGWAVGTNSPLQSAAGDTNARTNGAIQSVAALTVGTGSGTAGGNYNFGASGGSDRALGSLASTTITRLTQFSFVNNTGLEIISLTISYTGEQWRLGKTGNDATTGNPDTLFFGYSSDGINFTLPGSAFNFASPVTTGTTGPLDGNAAANRTTGIGGTFSVSIADGATFYLRWIDPDSTGADNGLAIDDFVMTAMLIPEPSTIALVGLGLLGALALRRRRS